MHGNQSGSEKEDIESVDHEEDKEGHPSGNGQGQLLTKRDERHSWLASLIALLALAVIVEGGLLAVVYSKSVQDQAALNAASVTAEQHIQTVAGEAELSVDASVRQATSKLDAAVATALRKLPVISGFRNDIDGLQLCVHLLAKRLETHTHRENKPYSPDDFYWPDTDPASGFPVSCLFL